MKIKRLFLLVLVLLVFTSCISNGIAWKTNTNIKKLELGMTKAEVIGIMGKKYMISSKSKNAQGELHETLGYKSHVDEEYNLHFINNLLTEWNREYIQAYPTQDSNKKQ